MVVLKMIPLNLPITGLGGPLGLQEVGAPGLPRQSAHKGGRVVIPMHWTCLPPRDIEGSHFCKRVT